MWKLPEKYRGKEVLYRRLILFALSLALIVVYFSQILRIIGVIISICLPFLIGGILAFCLSTFNRVIIRFTVSVLKIPYRSRFDPFYKVATTLVIGAALVGFFAFVGPAVVNSGQRVITELPEQITRFLEDIYIWSEKVPSLRMWMDENQQMIRDIPINLVRWLSNMALGGSAADTISGFYDVVSSTFGWIWLLFISLVFSFIAFFNSKAFIADGKMIAQAFMPPAMFENASYITRLIVHIFSQYLGGTLLECVILASLVIFFGSLLNIPNILFAGVFCGVCALVPMFGATTGAVICSLVMLMDTPGKAITFLIMFLCIQQVEGNFIYPNVVGKSVGLPAMYVVVAITIGGSLGGILGMILSIPVATVIYVLVTREAKARLKRMRNRPARAVSAAGAEEDLFADSFSDEGEDESDPSGAQQPASLANVFKILKDQAAVFSKAATPEKAKTPRAPTDPSDDEAGQTDEDHSDGRGKENETL